MCAYRILVKAPQNSHQVRRCLWMSLVRRRHIISRINAAHTETRVVDTFHNLAQVSWERIWSFKQRFSCLLWYFVSKIVLIYCEKKMFFRDSNLFGQSKVRTIFETEYFFFILLMEIPIRSDTLEQLKCQLEQIFGM